MRYLRKFPLGRVSEGNRLGGVEFPQKQNKDQAYCWVSEASKHKQLERNSDSQCHKKKKRRQLCCLYTSVYCNYQTTDEVNWLHRGITECPVTQRGIAGGPVTGPRHDSH